MVICLTVAYDGTDFCGWQTQPNGVSVQGVLQDALFTLLGEKVCLTGSGRTDAGVHAQGQKASFCVENCTIPPQKFAFALNPLLPPSIRVVDGCLMPDGFNACKSAKKKTYEYNFYFGKVENPLLDRYALALQEKPDLELMQSACKLFVGEHDFKCFNASGGGAKTTVRTIYDLSITENQNGFVISVTGNGFLYNMVRTLAGTLLEVGYGKSDQEKIQKMLVLGQRNLCGKTLPAKALTLKSVEY